MVRIAAFAKPILTASLLALMPLAPLADASPVSAHLSFEGPHIDLTLSGLGSDFSRDFRRAHPFRVFIALDAGRRGGRSRGVDNPGEREILASLADRLPSGIQLVSERRFADLVLRVSERHYDLAFHVVDRDREDKKYDKRDRQFAPGHCGYVRRAHYTEVTERGIARYAFDIGVRIPGQGRYRLSLEGQESEKFRYATDLVGASRCGPVAVDRFPSRKVRRLFERADPGYRRQVALEVRRDAMRDVGQKLARLVRHKSRLYWQAVASHYSTPPASGFTPTPRGHFDGPWDHQQDWRGFNHPGLGRRGQGPLDR